MENISCALGCSPTPNFYMFPSREHDINRRKAWLDFFDMEEPNIDYVFACSRHFSHLQSTTKGIRATAIPDIPIIYGGTTPPFRRKTKNWRENVIVVTPRDPEFNIYRHETGVFPQNLFNITDAIQPVIPMIKSVSCSMTTQTNTRLCGLIQISDIKEEYRLNCFYCSEMFAIEKWPKFVDHLKRNHFKKEEAFKMSQYLSQDHDYTSIGSSSIFPVKSSIKLNTVTTSFVQEPPPQPCLLEPIILPPLLAKPQKEIRYSKMKTQSTVEIAKSTPPPLLAKPYQSNEKPFNIRLADQLIKLLNETILSPNFLHTEEDNILIIKNTGSDNLETSNFLANIMNSESSSISVYEKSSSSVKSKTPTTTSSSKNTRPVYTIRHGQRDIPSRRDSLSRVCLQPLLKNKQAKLVQKRMAQQTLKNINIFENIYKTVKTRPPKVVESENVHLKDFNSNKVIEQRITPLSRFLKRTFTETIEAQPKKQKSTEIVFEYTPKDIILLLLESMKSYPVLWEFHEQPYNKSYNKAIEELCQIVNDKWALNITLLKMRRSIIRILRFYRLMLPRESIDQFEDYFDKCALFLPSSADEIPRARCAYCCICYKKDGELRKHTIERHKCLKWPYKCQHCWERFRESDEYELHKRLPHYEEIFKCEQCDKRFNRRNLYNKHVGSHQRSKELRMEAAIRNQPGKYIHVCDVCQVHFTHYYELKRHKQSHVEKLEKLKCSTCQKDYCSKKSLEFHMMRHRKEYDFICEVCGKGFIRKASLDNHMDTHTGAKITCNICNLKLRKCSLSRHLRLVHVAIEGTIESTFRAQSYRYRKYLLPKNLQKVKRCSKGPRQYNCKICKTTFGRLKQLKDHNKEIHSNVKRTPCRICNLEFLHLQNLKRHYREKHKLHIYQAFKLVNLNEDLNTVLAMKTEELDAMGEARWPNNQDNVKKVNGSQDDNFFDSDKIQDEIMKAVENIDEQEEIKVDDDHSMNDFFTELFSNHS